MQLTAASGLPNQHLAFQTASGLPKSKIGVFRRFSAFFGVPYEVKSWRARNFRSIEVRHAEFREEVPPKIAKKRVAFVTLVFQIIYPFFFIFFFLMGHVRI